jgi:soluble lytic murein transglycosylase-like protein
VWYGSKYGVDWRLLSAQVAAESGYNPDAESPVGAKGLAQFMDPTWKDFEEFIGGSRDPFNPEHSIEAQAWYMDKLGQIFDTDYSLMLAAYNWGMGNVRRIKDKHEGEWYTHLPAETRNYIPRILNLHMETDR